MKDEQQKNIGFENDRVSKLLGSLKRVDAPGDFDFHVRARIAAGRPADRTTSWLPGWVKLAMPLALLLLVGGYFGFNMLYSAGKLNAPNVAEVHATNVAPAVNLPVSQSVPLPANDVVVSRIEPKASAPGDKVNLLTPEKKTISTPDTSVRQPGGGSIDSASNIGRKIDPKGLSPNRSLSKPKDFDRGTGIPAADVLSMIGIEGGYAKSSWTISGVKPNSKAEHSGLKAGDVIEAVNAQLLTDKTVFGSNFDGKTVRIRRSGKTMQIDLKP